MRQASFDSLATEQHFKPNVKAFIKTKSFCPARLSWEQNSFKDGFESMIWSHENTHSQLKSIMLIYITEEANSQCENINNLLIKTSGIIGRNLIFYCQSHNKEI